ncbi:ATPase, T2SS/T4P/T4SS family [Natranaeroarchaeum sulfidigenes]|uniref:ATPase involved in archaellum/pili biosynthesis n=1 Tax=Natranaeroarchaeum sulfidigenes TaxID=2784880 RepID=A0A897MVY3_9EURY|nr:ATPase involved in archaellum/pili biosynthesis [Natranaeroarchaeum sulfidigenes]
MAIDDADQSGSRGFESADESAAPTEDEQESSSDTVRVGEYTWADFMEEFGYGDEVDDLYPDPPEEELGLDSGDDEELEPPKPTGEDWQNTSLDPAAYLGFQPDGFADVVSDFAAPWAKDWDRTLWSYIDPMQTSAVKDEYEWEHFKQEFYYEGRGTDVQAPRDSNGEPIPWEPSEYLGFDPETIGGRLHAGGDRAKILSDLIDERTVNVREEVDEDEFFSTDSGYTTVVNRYDLEKAVPMAKKLHFREENRYWVNKPYAFVILFHSEKENEKKYYLIEPYQNEIEDNLREFLTGKLRTAIKYADDEIATAGDEESRKDVLDRETKRLLRRYDLFSATADQESGIVDEIKKLMGKDVEDDDEERQIDGIEVRPEPAVLADDPEDLTEYQVEKLLYLLKRDFIGYERIDGIKHDINVEDISCDGYNSPVFVYHTDYEQIISNVYHGKEELDDFVVKLAQRSGKGISKRRPQVDATLPDGSRSQLTLGREVSDHGTNYTIRQFKDVPFTPIDLINWNTFSLDEMAFLWLCIENHKSLIFAGGTASGKTTSLNAVSLFIPSNTKIVSIEDTREVELPQRNWIASITRPSFSDDDEGDVDEFDLLEAALRQRPDYIVMGEIRGEEGRTLFQVMSTGHTTYTTFHADSVGEVLKRFTTEPINVSKTMFTALDLVSIQTQTRVQGHKVRRNKELTEVNHYDAENDEINVQDVYQWQAETDEFLKMGESNTLEEIKFDRGWGQERLDRELEERRTILAYLIKNDLSEYSKVAATIQAYINDPDTILTLIANGQLEESLEDLREMESVLIDVDPEKEALVPRPSADEEGMNEATDVLERAQESIFEEYRGKTPSGLSATLDDMAESADTEATSDTDEFDVTDDAFGVDEDSFDFGMDDVDDPDWLSEEDGFFFGSDDSTGEANADAGGTDTVATDARDAIENLSAGGADVEGTTDSRSDLPASVPDDEAASATAPEASETTTSPNAGSTAGSDADPAEARSDATAESSTDIPQSPETETDSEPGGDSASAPIPDDMPEQDTEAQAPVDTDEPVTPAWDDGTGSDSDTEESGKSEEEPIDDTGSVFGETPESSVFSEYEGPDDGSLFDDRDEKPFGEDAGPVETDVDQRGAPSRVESDGESDVGGDQSTAAESEPEITIEVPDEEGATTDADNASDSTETEVTETEKTDEPEIEPSAESPRHVEPDTESHDATGPDEQASQPDQPEADGDDGGTVFDEIDSDEDGTVFDEIDSDEDEERDGDIVDERIEGFEYVEFDAEDGED